MTRKKGGIVRPATSADRAFELIAPATQPQRLADNRTVSVPAGCRPTQRYGN